jgi:hypothetical protein
MAPSSKAFLTNLSKSDAKFKKLVGQYGLPEPVSGASGKNPGDICMETDCVDGKKIVMRRDKSGDCTEYSEEDC